MPYASLLRIFVPASILLAALVFGLLRLGSGAAAVSGLGYLPAGILPGRLRRFLFGERNRVPRSLQK